MATKAERFRSEAEKAAHARHPQKPAHESAGKRAAERGRTKGRIPNPTSHNEAPRLSQKGRATTHAKKATYELEVSATSRPSRKSTRRSPNHIKPDSALRITEMNRNASPTTRSGRRGSNPT
jgi:hypothetical protein